MEGELDVVAHEVRTLAAYLYIAGQELADAAALKSRGEMGAEIEQIASELAEITTRLASLAERLRASSR